MKKLIFTLTMLVSVAFSVNAQIYSVKQRSSSSASVNSSVRYQNSYHRTDGTLVQGHYKTTLNQTNHDNFSTSNNVNSFTGVSGNRAKDYSPQALNYGKDKVIHTGSKGGQYYHNTQGNRTYVPKRTFTY